MGDLLKYGLIAVGGYLLYNQFMKPGATAVAAAVPPAAPPPAPPPAYTYAPPTLTQALAEAAKPNTTLNADQWKYYYDRLSGTHTGIPDAAFTALFFPSGRPANPDDAPTMSALDFVSAIATKGLSGLGLGALRFPRVITQSAALAVMHARIARGQNYLPAGTPMRQR